ncbi:MAG TPA: PBP1A family penicillin-binding protein [Deltaproteobacteria bacterium]|nr:PBP1A family penicillin-binding protein [Deltaproteobacteria bacterium]
MSPRCLVSVLGIAVLVILFMVTLDAYRQVRKIGTGSIWNIPSKIYSMPLAITPGSDLLRTGFEQRLQRLRYRSVSEVRSPGEYGTNGDAIAVFLRGFDHPGGRAEPALREIHTARGIVEEIRNPLDGSLLESVVLEPELLAEIFDERFEDRVIISLDECPTSLLDAIIVTEDRRFYDHRGIDFRSILRAFLINLRQGHVVEGGSTITQQLVKNLFLTTEKSLLRKARESMFAVLMEMVYTKQEILTLYLNEIYMGRRGHAGIHGIGRSSRLFFDKEVPDLDLAEAALLAGIIRAPNRYSPYTSPHRAMMRRNTVLELMFREGYITSSEFAQAQLLPIEVVELEPLYRQAPYFIDHVMASLGDEFPAELLSRGGYRIFTTLDAHMQHTCEGVLQHVLSSLPHHIDGAVVVLDPETGGIRALVGGKNYAKSQFNRATQIQRHIGSLIKPVIYYTALRRGSTLSRLVDDSPLSVKLDDGSYWRPVNYDGSSHGRVILFEALVKSYNIATVRLGLEVGLDNVITEIQGILPECSPAPHPSILLGAVSCSPLDMARLYSTFANGGFRTESSGVLAVTNEHGTILASQASPKRQRVLDPVTLYLVNTALQEVVISGTAKDARMYGMPEGICGKTGTTNDKRDSWFAGFSPGMTVVVWLGDDLFQPIGYSGATGAMPVASMILHQLAHPFSREAPKELVLCRIDPANGKRAGLWTKHTVELPFIRGTEPLEVSEEGAPALLRFFKSILKK